MNHPNGIYMNLQQFLENGFLYELNKSLHAKGFQMGISLDEQGQALPLFIVMGTGEEGNFEFTEHETEMMEERIKDFLEVATRENKENLEKRIEGYLEVVKDE